MPEMIFSYIISLLLQYAITIKGASLFVDNLHFYLETTRISNILFHQNDYSNLRQD